MNLMTIDVFSTLKQAIKSVFVFVAEFFGFLVFAAFMPMVMILLPLFLLIKNPSENYVWLQQIFFLLAPLSCGFYMTVLCHWHSYRLWRRNGWGDWREAHGGIIRTCAKSTLFMIVGIIGSYLFELLFLYGYSLVPYTISGTARVALGFTLFPVASFAPVILLLIKRRNYSEGGLVAPIHG